MFAKELVLFLTIIKCLCYGEFIIPEVALEAYDPQGFRASIPALDGIQMFAFHANINENISQVDPGNFSKDLTSPNGNLWSYDNPDLKLKVGDKVYYWIFIQFQKLGYRKDSQVWEVTELVKRGDKPCQSSISIVSGKTWICKDNLLFEDNFNKDSFDRKFWKIDQYIPTYESEDYEFVSYQDNPDVCYVANNKLYIKPKVAESENEVNDELDFRGRCTRLNEKQCYWKRQIYLIIPPVTSARIVSKFKFRYGKIEIKAKLPCGDWIFPQMYLEQVNDPSKRLWIAYARGNERLIGNNENDIGGQLLFGGPVLSFREPERSKYLKTKRNNRPFTKQWHIYTVIWSKEEIVLQVDNQVYGRFDRARTENIGFARDDLVQIVLGVGVGGVNDFPDDFKSNGDKPWRNNDGKQVKNFFSAKDEWSTTWNPTTDDSALQVEYVKIWAV